MGVGDVWGWIEEQPQPLGWNSITSCTNFTLALSFSSHICSWIEGHAFLRFNISSSERCFKMEFLIGQYWSVNIFGGFAWQLTGGRRRLSQVFFIQYTTLKMTLVNTRQAANWPTNSATGSTIWIVTVWTVLYFFSFESKSNKSNLLLFDTKSDVRFFYFLKKGISYICFLAVVRNVHCLFFMGLVGQVRN